MKTKLEIKDKSRQTEEIKVAPFREHIRKTSPHKHNNYFEIIYLIKGKGSHTVDTKEYEIKTPVIFIIRKDQVHFWDIKTEPKGFVLIIKKTFIENCLDKEIKRLISELRSQTCLFPKDTASVGIFRLLLKEYLEKSATKRPIINGPLKALLGKFVELTTPNFLQNSNNTIFQKYSDLMNQENKLINKVKHYTSLLNITPQNLNEICRKEKNQSATEYYQNI